MDRFLYDRDLRYESFNVLLLPLWLTLTHIFDFVVVFTSTTGMDRKGMRGHSQTLTQSFVFYTIYNNNDNKAISDS